MEDYFYLQGCVNAAIFLADGFLVGGDPFFHRTDAYAVDGGELGECAGFDFDAVGDAGHCY